MSTFAWCKNRGQRIAREVCAHVNKTQGCPDRRPCPFSKVFKRTKFPGGATAPIPRRTKPPAGQEE